MTVQDDRFGAMLAAEFGAAFDDLRDVLRDRPGFNRRPLSGIEYIAVHHSVTPKTATWASVQQSHFARGFSGVGYTIGVRLGRVALFGDIEQARACCKGINHLVLCICVTGDYTRDTLDDVDRAALRRVVAVIDKFLGRSLPIRGHGQLPGQSTACPGGAILAALPALRGAPIPPPPPPQDGVLAAALVAEAASRQAIRLNPAASLQRAIAAAGMVPTSDEFVVVVGGVVYHGQRAERIDAARSARVYYARAGDWDAVRFLPILT